MRISDWSSDVCSSDLPDPLAISMMHSPLADDYLHGPQLLDFMADACVMRTRTFYDVGGYWPPLFAGGEDRLMALDLADRGWRIIYARDVVIHRRHGSAPNAAADQAFKANRKSTRLNSR